MLPTYEPDERLLQALAAVLAQAPGPDAMQITVVDDGSRAGLVEDLVRTADPRGRVEVVLHRGRLGLAGNWNRAIDLARGHLVHILHQDDCVLPGFYSRITRGFAAASEIGMAFCRSRIIDGAGRLLKVNSRLRWFPGVIDDWLATIAERQRVQTPAAVVARSTYEAIGGYRPDLCQALDWEMWVRIAARYPVWYEPRPLAAYRRHETNESTRLATSGELWPDITRAIEINSWSLPDHARQTLMAASCRWHASSALRSAERLIASGATDQAIAILAALPRMIGLADSGPPEPTMRRFAALRERLGRGPASADVGLERCA
jgi:hypothetical protein